ncbi:MAG: metal ABC transporter substrate-binding protein [Nocardioidaceae bacterium]
MSRPTAVLAAVLCGSVLSAGCGGSAAGNGGTTVVAAFYPLAYVAERVAGNHASVSNLTAPGAEPHDLELTPQQIAEVAEADLVLYEHGFQPAVDDAVGENDDGTVVDASEVALPASTDDPHLWQDPTKLATVAEAMARALARADPDHAGAYRANADALVGDLRALDRDFHAGLDDCRRRTIVTSHAAFGHLAQRYDLEMIPITGISPHSEPSLARLAELEDVVADKDVTTVFYETLASPDMARTLAGEVGVRTAVLDPIEGLSGTTDDEDYFSLMRSNLAALRTANGCR